MRRAPRSVLELADSVFGLDDLTISSILSAEFCRDFDGGILKTEVEICILEWMVYMPAEGDNKSALFKSILNFRWSSEVCVPECKPGDLTGGEGNLMISTLRGGILSA